MVLRSVTSVVVALLLLPSSLLVAQDLEFAKDVRPILATHCFTCHGPDADAREADLRLDEHDAVLAASTSGDTPVVPGDPERSELLLRMLSDDVDLRMPPEDVPARPTPEEIDVIRRWISEGASWGQHWSFVSPSRPTLPSNSTDTWSQQPTDRFVYDRLSNESWQPSSPATRETLLRRLALDLNGVAPSTQFFSTQKSNAAPDAIGRFVDQLLSSPRYGETMASAWLDAARYADTNGYQIDNGRTMWPWRDWVLDALNSGMPFDQFTIEQLAGDLLPNPTPDQLIATGFHRNHGLNSEGGTLDEEARTEYVFDRVKTTGTVWLGMTIGCAQCHDHKYDPVTHEDYYRLFAFFNQNDEVGVAGLRGNAAPKLTVKWPERQRKLNHMMETNTRLKRQLRGARDLQRYDAGYESPTRLAERLWEEQGRCDPGYVAEVQDFLCLFELNERVDNVFPGCSNNSHELSIVGNVDRDFDEVSSWASFEGDGYLESINLGDLSQHQPFSLSLRMWVPAGQRTDIVAKGGDAGYFLSSIDGHVHVTLTSDRGVEDLEVRTAEPLPDDEWWYVVVNYDGSSTANGIKIYVDGTPVETEVLSESLSGDIRNEFSFLVGGNPHGHDGANMIGGVDDVGLLDREMTSLEIVSNVADRLIDIFAMPEEERSEFEAVAVRELFLISTDLPFVDLRNRQRAVQRSLNEVRINELTTMIMRDRKEARKTCVLERGQYDRPGAEIDRADIPSAFGSLPQQTPTRLDLARWIVSRENPLTARTIVNREWLRFFGRGIVATTDDLGVRGAAPSHPQLLDWLACEFIESGWDMKHLHRLIVTSATYQQRSATTADQRKRDPQNRLLSHMSRRRLSAETLRDQMLSASGLLMERVGGPPVYPMQPPGMWKDVSFDPNYTAQEYTPSDGVGLYRRSVYTFRKRSSPPPSLQLFDAPDRTTCSVSRRVTSTPLQSLFLMHDETVLVCAEELANSLMDLPKDARLNALFHRALARTPTTDERDRLLDFWRTLRTTGTTEYDAWTKLSHLILICDEAISRN